MNQKPVYVTQPYLPPLDEFIPYLEKIWDSKILTNGGPMHQQLEQALCDYLGVEHIALFNNGTIALLTALQALRVTGEVITTPYSFVATAHSLLWNGIKPVFVDIDPHTFNIDPSKVEAAITPQTTAIMPVHCYGHPCDVRPSRKSPITTTSRLSTTPLMPSACRTRAAACCVMATCSVLSFHATKVFNTFEGGAIICPDAKTKLRIDHLKNFGFVDEITVVAPGINGKMSEINAAFGMLQLRHIDQVLARRREIDGMYREQLKGVRGVSVPDEANQTVANHSYFPVLIDADYPLSRDVLYQKLKDRHIFARRYFYPLISEFPMYRGMLSAQRGNLPVASGMAEKVLCLPIYPALSDEDIARVVSAVRGA